MSLTEEQKVVITLRDTKGGLIAREIADSVWPELNHQTRFDYWSTEQKHVTKVNNILRCLSRAFPRLVSVEHHVYSNYLIYKWVGSRKFKIEEDKK